ncbi:thioredoxin domain-containing protein, partial [Brevundimonas sp.]
MGKRQLSLASMAAVSVAIGSMFATSVMAESASPTRSAPTPRPATPAAPAVAASVTAPLASDRVLGRADAPITIIEYASFTCSHCANFTNTVLPRIKAEYIDTGKAKLIFRDLPTPPVQVSQLAAAVARCAAPDRFFTVADHLMHGQSAAFANGKIGDWFKGAVELSGRTEQQISTCVSDPATKTSLDSDTESAIAV